MNAIVRSTPSPREEFPIVTKGDKNYLCVNVLHPAYRLKGDWQCITPACRLSWVWGFILDGAILPAVLAEENVAPEERYKALKSYVSEGYQTGLLIEAFKQAAKHHYISAEEIVAYHKSQVMSIAITLNECEKRGWLPAVAIARQHVRQNYYPFVREKYQYDVFISSPLWVVVDFPTFYDPDECIEIKYSSEGAEVIIPWIDDSRCVSGRYPLETFVGNIIDGIWTPIYRRDTTAQSMLVSLERVVEQQEDADTGTEEYYLTIRSRYREGTLENVLDAMAHSPIFRELDEMTVLGVTLYVPDDCGYSDEDLRNEVLSRIVRLGHKITLTEQLIAIERNPYGDTEAVIRYRKTTKT